MLSGKSAPLSSAALLKISSDCNAPADDKMKDHVERVQCHQIFLRYFLSPELFSFYHQIIHSKTLFSLI